MKAVAIGIKAEMLERMKRKKNTYNVCGNAN
jgi:hypothetical protein